MPVRLTPDQMVGAEFIKDGVRHRAAPATGSTSRYDHLLAMSRASAEAFAGHDALTDDDLYGNDGLPA